MKKVMMSGFSEITVKDLSRFLGMPSGPVVLDLRIPEDAKVIPTVIPCAQFMAYEDLAANIEQFRGRHVVTICHKGRKISHGAAALLRANGIPASVLAGGMVAWEETDFPSTPRTTLPATSLWVTRARPKIDRIACPWLIRRFVDPAARFMFVPEKDVMDVAGRFDAIAFDVNESLLSHVGPQCTFDVLIEKFGLNHPALARLATVVRAADTDQHALAPQASGLLAMSVGLSMQYDDDNAQLDAAMPIYDALYHWARDGFDEDNRT